MCSICYTMITQADQLGNQLGHVTSHIRALFHKMVQLQTEAVRRNRAAQTSAPAGTCRDGDGAGAAPVTGSAVDRVWEQTVTREYSIIYYLQLVKSWYQSMVSKLISS